MKAPLKQSDYPRYFNTGSTLLAFTGPDKMYKVEAIGSNKNPGVTIDHYITRNMVLRHWPGPGYEINSETFRALVEKLYRAYFDRMTGNI